jgi:hypothetical protein
MARNTTFIPATPPGEISKLVIATNEDDAAFKTLLTAQQTAINAAYEHGRERTTVMFLRPTEIPTGPSATFAVIHPSGAAEAQVVCIHALRAYHLGSLIPAGTDPGLVSKMFGFVGEIVVEDGTTILPRCLLQPADIAGLAENQPTRVPEDGALGEAFATYDNADDDHGGFDELMAANLPSVDTQLPKLLVIPTVLFPIFATAQSPRSALRKMEAIVAAMPDGDRALFDRTTQFLRASCVKKGGNGGNRDTSRMSTLWTAAPSPSATFRSWTRATMRSLYPEAFVGGGNPNLPNAAAAGPTALFGAGAAEAFATSLSTATTVAMETLGNKLKEARAEERQDTKDEKTNKSKWSELAQNRILRCHGHDALVMWDPQNVTDIWGHYQDAMREGTSPVVGIMETFASYFHRDPSVLEGERPQLSISTTTAKCIKEGRICPQPGVLMYENIDEGLMPLAFVRRESHEILEDTYQQEEYERSNHHTIEGERARSSRCTTKKAPDTYSDTVSLLRGYAVVTKGHFSEASAGFKAIDRVFRCLVNRQDTWKNAWNGEVGARFWWLFSKAVHAWMSPSEWGHGGVAPSMDVDPIISCLAGGNFGSQVDLPIKLIMACRRPVFRTLGGP